MHAVDFLRLMDFDSLNQLVEHARRELAGAGVLSDDGEECVGGHCLTATFLQLSLDSLHAFGKFHLFRFVACAHAVEAFVADFSRNVILVEPFKELVQLFITRAQLV